MFQRKSRRFRRRSNGRGSHSHSNGQPPRLRPNLFIHNQPRNNFRTTQTPEKLFEQYNALAKEAMSSGDKTSCENYLQHADHFARIIEDRNKNQNKSNTINKPLVESKSSKEFENKEIPSENSVETKE